MCIVSNIGDSWQRDFPERWPQIATHIPTPTPPIIHLPLAVSQADFDALRKEVKELKKLLQAAATYDAATGQPHCEADEKVKLIKAIARLVGVDLGEVFNTEKKQ